MNVFTRQSARWGESITLSTEGSSWESRGTITGKLNLVTGDASQACAGSEVQLKQQQQQQAETDWFVGTAAVRRAEIDQLFKNGT